MELVEVSQIAKIDPKGIYDTQDLKNRLALILERAEKLKQLWP